MTAFADAPCVGRWWLWDSTYPADHKQAAAECATCPALTACRELLRQEQAVGRTLSSSGGGPRGTWAGRLVGKHEREPVNCAWQVSGPVETIVHKDTTNASAPEQRRWNAARGPRRTKDTTDV